MEGTSRIFVKGLPPSLTVEEFRKHFSKQSPITDAKFIPHRRIGYVGFRTPEDAARAVKYHNRTFIRLSKIGVELARSVEEQQQQNLKTWKSGANASPVTHNEAIGHKDGHDTSDAIEHPRKRIRVSAQEDEGDANLQEFLQVMQRPSKSKTWENQDVLGAQKALAVEPEVQKVPTTDAMSDGEYSPVPKKQKKSKKESSIPADTPSKEHVVHTNEESTPMETKEDVTDAPQEALGDAPAKTDDDWLRSKTSRLLGLVDDDDALTIRAPQQDQKKSKSSYDAEGSDSGDEKGSDVGVQTEESAEREEPAQPAGKVADTEEPRVGSGRLFLRNLTYSTTEEDIRKHFESNGYAGIEEVQHSHQPLFFTVGHVMNIQIGTTYAMHMMSTGRNVLVDASCFLTTIVTTS